MIGVRLSFVLRSGLLLSALAVLPASRAIASVDGCSPDWQLSLGTKSDCDNVAALTPGNDTRVNLLLLLERHGTPSKPSAPVIDPVLEWRDFQKRFSENTVPDAKGFALGEGSRCRSNDAGAALFEAAVKAAAGLSPDERSGLLAAREKLQPDCAGGGSAVGTAASLSGVQTDAGKSFATYLRGSEAFYAERFDDADKAFKSLASSADPWLADTAAYMVARTRVNALQVHAFDRYGTFKGSEKVDQQTASGAETGLEEYLKNHPNGRYVGSARGLLRRVDWLAGWTDKATIAYAALLAQPAASRGIDDVSLVEEIDSKLLPRLTPQMTRDPVLLAVLDLKAMRKTVGQASSTRIELDSQRDAFGSNKPLFELLEASAAFYLDGATAPVLKGIPDDTRRRDGDTLWFSRQLLRGQALEAAADRNTQGFWKELYPGATRPLDQATVELALALHQERHGALADVFAAGSLVTNSTMRIILLENVAGPALLRQQARDASASQLERDQALATLLYKELTRGRYADFLADLRDAPTVAPVTDPVSPAPASDAGTMLRLLKEGESAGDIGCPALSTTVAQLARDPEGSNDRLCLAEFVRVNGLDGAPLDIQPPKDALGGTPSLFPGKPYSRESTYQAIIVDKQAPAADRAFALYRAVNCYATSGVNHCGGDGVPKPERKAWYTELKRSYPTSRWAKTQTVWW